MAAETKPTIVLIHGLWMTPLCWEDWIKRYEAKGHRVLAPGWPGIEGRSPQDVRADPKAMVHDSIASIVDSYAAAITSLPSSSTPVIIMGHSFGGLFAQILLSRGLGAAGVALCPANPAGVFALPWSTVRAGLPVLANPGNYFAAVRITADEFHYCFGNHLSSRAESDALWERYSVPAVAHVLFQGALGSKEAAVEFDKQHRAPLLLMAGTVDHVVPQSTVHKEFAAYEKHKKEGGNVVEFKVWEGRSHGIVNQEGWEEVADYALEWAMKHIK